MSNLLLITSNEIFILNITVFTSVSPIWFLFISSISFIMFLFFFKYLYIVKLAVILACEFRQ